ncbi:MAG TPA: pantoate--beta-alanine ligase [Pirellulaceae bacterium]|nr:pantoate--beta-alanine ligase [Pirellulaceae bacterium]HMO92670.1 pantoate--beta-alanine ligase [Pirellulaceae bacterium]HMP70582.1 pantoate--beta-alanine ligase [Pirellulaceae bacterium]
MNSQPGVPGIPTFSSIEAIREFVATCRRRGQSIGFVPTMGALHAGHLSLAQRSKVECDVTVVSIYVNPSQFGPQEDFTRYPRPLEQDLLLLDGHADAVFLPTDDLMYPVNFSTWVNPPEISNSLEGEFRPTHFRGVATVVLKLLNLVTPDCAYFGQKDYQQLQVIRKMVDDLQVPVKVVGCPIVRDEHGLALSSRNAYLTDEQRQRALALSRTLDSAERAIRNGESDGHALMAEMKQHLIDGGVSDLDYAVVADPHTLRLMEHVHLPAVLLLAAHVDQVRLIDNRLIEPTSA